MKIYLDGVSAGIIRSNEDGTRLTISGWSRKYRRINKGENIIIVTSAGQEAQYLAEKVSRPNNVTDQYFIDFIFNPRKVA